MKNVSFIHGLFGYIGQDVVLAVHKFHYADKLAKISLEDISKWYADHLIENDIEI